MPARLPRVGPALVSTRSVPGSRGAVCEVVHVAPVAAATRASRRSGAAISLAMARASDALMIFTVGMASSFHDLVQRVLDNTLGPRQFQLWNQVAHGRLFDDRVERHPLAVGKG